LRLAAFSTRLPQQHLPAAEEVDAGRAIADSVQLEVIAQRELHYARLGVEG
jgi:hypothetical protein